ncbi:RNA-binding S4 domain-containing protein [Rothia halotolerans]|uniref:RNA-binding S4 domain-containing protein n=1 Tax=Rothia halotolerans TaxID=405770 RepID=UPI00101B7EE0|nr:RNA-binding S4 domain-containing protein [Rothia halotolerans]
MSPANTDAASPDRQAQPAGPASVRIDAWLWAVRIYKTRSAATTGCRAGHVRLNDQPVKASQALRAGDVVKVRTPGWERVFEVTRLIVKRVGASVAQQCYVDHSPPRPSALSAPVPRRERGAGRPTKKERREMDRLRGQG